jgi:hypothetical protein
MLTLSAVRHEVARWSTPSVLHRALAGILIASVVSLEAWAVLGPHEDWPFSSAPMFARYHARGEPLYEFVLVAQHADGARVVIQAKRHLGLGELGFRRQFFGRVYGSTDPEHPSGHHPSDDAGKFRQRLTIWMRKVAATYKVQTGRSAVSLSLELRQVSPRSESREVARYYVASQQMALTTSGKARPPREP